MGEIGIDRRTFLYDLHVWEVRRIIAGYRKREHKEWERTRWQTFWLMHNGMVDLNKAGIHSEQDIVKFPWERPGQDDLPTDEEIEEMRQRLQKANRQSEEQ